MMRCRECGERLPGDPDRFGARCPACREPLYDDPLPRRRDRVDGQCPVHPESPAVGTCGRCGNYLCETCRTRWRERWLCAACVELALDRKEAVPAEARAHLRQAILALALGVTSWLIFLLSGVLVIAGMEGDALPLAVVGGLMVFVSPLPSAIGVGQGLAALRGRGDHMILATLGLVLCGLNVGAFIGLLSFSIASRT
jgi:hypothetical protein